MEKNVSALLDKNQLLLMGEVDRRMFEYVYEATRLLATRDYPDIEISITSNGGSVGFGLDIYDLLRLYPGKKVVTIISIAASMAAIIAQACNTRKVAQHAKVLIHYVSRKDISLSELKDPTKLTKIITDLEVSQSRLEAILVGRTGKPVEVIQSECEKDRPMTAEEALAFGLVDEIV